MERLRPGDVVYCEGASALLGDVVDVVPDADDGEADQVTVAWRATTTTEWAGDLVRHEGH